MGKSSRPNNIRTKKNNRENKTNPNNVVEKSRNNRKGKLWGTKLRKKEKGEGLALERRCGAKGRSGGGKGVKGEKD